MAFRPDVSQRWPDGALRRGYTLIELLLATTLTLILMGAVVQVFSGVGTGISKARRSLETLGRLRGVEAELRMDLQGLTATMVPPRHPEDGEGYFEYVESGDWVTGSSVDSPAINPEDPYAAGGSGRPGPYTLSGVKYWGDTTVGQRSDILMFTTRNASRPFVGKYAGSTGGTIQSEVAEVAWYLRGRTLHRRVLLITPGIITNGPLAFVSNFYANNDVSVRKAGNQLIPNSLGDLTKRENRFGHSSATFPFDVRGWGQLQLPTLNECSSAWMAGWQTGSTPPPKAPAAPANVDMWSKDAASGRWFPDNQLGTGTRVADDIVMTNVIGFDVKAWDPKMRQYVDLGIGTGDFKGTGQNVGSDGSRLNRTYDTWSTHYETEGYKSTTTVAGGRATNGMDDDNNGVVDDINERITQPPYPVPLRGIQVKIRVFEPDSREVFETTVVQDFLPR